MSGTVPRWDLEVDLAAVGSGIGGLAAAITAHECGLTTAVLEKANMLGGVTAFSMGEVWVGANDLQEEAGIADSEEEALAYLRWLGAGHGQEERTRHLVTVAREALRYFADKAGVQMKIIKGFSDYYYPKGDGSKAEGRFLEPVPFDGKLLGEWAAKTRMSPLMPSGITHDEMFAWGNAANLRGWDWELYAKRVEDDVRTFGPGLAAYFVKAALDRDIPLHLETPVQELIRDGAAVIGVRARKDGRDFYVRARRGVLLATGGYDWNKEMALYYEQLPEWNSSSPPEVTGDHLVMAGEAGAIVASVPAVGMPTLLGMHVPGEENGGQPLYRAVISEVGMPHALLVNRQGRRFADESFYRSFMTAVRTFDGATQSYPNWPCFVIFDQNHRDKYPFCAIGPGRPLPPEMAVQADTIGELAEKLGIDRAGLEETVRRFNEYARAGHDPEFGRGTFPWSNMFLGDVMATPNANLGPVEKPPFYGLRPTVTGMGINAAGLKVNNMSQVISLRGQPIPGLYAAGNAVAFLDIGSGYQSGISNTRGMVHGYLAALHAADR